MAIKHTSVMSYISIIIAGFALTLNVIGIYLIRKQSSQRTHQNLIILHLSVFQILILNSTLVYWVSVLYDVGEKNTVMVWNTSFFTSSRAMAFFLIAILTFNRLFAIKYKVRYTSIVSKRRVKVALIASWLSWVVSFSILLGKRSEALLHVLSAVVFPVGDGVILLLILYTYSYIYWTIRESRRKLSDIKESKQQTALKSKQVLRVSTAIIVSFASLVLLPDIIVSIADHYMEREASEAIACTEDLLKSCYYLTLPVTYIFLHRNLRRMFLEAVGKCCSKMHSKANKANMIVVADRKELITTL